MPRRIFRELAPGEDGNHDGDANDKSDQQAKGGETHKSGGKTEPVAEIFCKTLRLLHRGPQSGIIGENATIYNAASLVQRRPADDSVSVEILFVNRV